MEVVEKKCCSVEIIVSTNGGRCEGKSIEGVVDDRNVVAWVHCGDPGIITIAIAALFLYNLTKDGQRSPLSNNWTEGGFNSSGEHNCNQVEEKEEKEEKCHL